MPKMLTWNGEDHLHENPDDAPHFNRWGPYRFEKGKPQRVEDEYVISKAGPPFWKVEDCPGEKGKPESKEDKAKLDKLVTEAFDEAATKAAEEKREEERQDFSRKVAKDRDNDRLKENARLAAEHAAREALKPQNRGKSGYTPAS